MATPQRKQDFPTLPRSEGAIGTPGKMVKMIQARCRVCNDRGLGPRGWWEDCTHEPYYHFEPKKGVQTMQKRTVTDPETGEETEAWFRRKLTEEEYDQVPNWKQIAHDIKITSGRMVQIQIERGSIFPEDLGFPPICDFRNCWEINPSVHVTYAPIHEESDVRVPIGNYHTEEEAGVMTLRFEGVPIYVGSDSNISKGNRALRAKQISDARR